MAEGNIEGSTFARLNVLDLVDPRSGHAPVPERIYRTSRGAVGVGPFSQLRTGGAWTIPALGLVQSVVMCFGIAEGSWTSQAPDRVS